MHPRIYVIHQVSIVSQRRLLWLAWSVISMEVRLDFLGALAGFPGRYGQTTGTLLRIGGRLLLIDVPENTS